MLHYQGFEALLKRRDAEIESGKVTIFLTISTNIFIYMYIMFTISMMISTIVVRIISVMC